MKKLSLFIVMLLLNGSLLFSQPAINTDGGTTTSFTIGQSYGGGIIFYIDGTGLSGLIAAPGDQSSGAQWGCTGTIIPGADGTSIGTGHQNTIDILAGCATLGIAARLCSAYTGGDFSDWFLPSQDELNEMYLQRTLIGGFISNYYWSSTEKSAFKAWLMFFGTGPQDYYKDETKAVRAIRAFSPTMPAITTAIILNIAQTTATSGGDVTSDGGATVTARGVCWSTSSTPTTSGSHTTDGDGTGVFVSSLTGLTANTSYYIRAYATNTVGTAYGNELSFTSSSFSIGQSYGGGIIFYVDGTGKAGLISATSDQSTYAPWGCYGTFLGTSNYIGTGQANTTAIVNGCGTAGIAARLCNDLVLNGYSDWFLPSYDELGLMYGQKTVIGGFSDDLYWSSSEYNDQDAQYRNFSNGGWNYFNKDITIHVRAVRAFSIPTTTTVTGTITGTACYNATQTITVAGNGTTFLVENGGSVTLVAGSKIVLLPGAKVNNGGYLHGYITTNNTFCGSGPNQLVANPENENLLGIETVIKNQFIKVYPNPTTDIVTVELIETGTTTVAKVTVYSMLGDQLLQKTINGESKFQFSLSGNPVGIYMVHVQSGDRSEIAKVIKTN